MGEKEINNMTDKEKVAAFTKSLQPAIEEEERFYKELPIGSKFWIPCAGNSSIGNECEHTGNIHTYLGNREFEKGEWITKEEAKGREDIQISYTSTCCPECKASFMNNEKT